MTTRSGPIYEVTFFVEPDAAEEFDLWLGDHVRTALREPGVVDCNLFPIANDEEGRARRVCLHVLESDEALEAFLDGTGGDIDTELALRFPEHASSQGRVLREDLSPEVVQGASPDCLNCGNRLRGQYCGNCGQRSRSRLISLWELVSDAFGDLFELDSRLWQTLIPLMVRPGHLTRDYLEGRRARYMPPFRMYLVLSLLFFVVAFFDPREELGLLFEPQPEVATEATGADETSATETPATEADAIKQEILDDLAEEGIVVDDESTDGWRIDEDGIRFTIDGDDDDEAAGDGDCNVEASDLEDLPAWLARRMTVERLQRICERTRLDDGRALVDNLVDNIPAALIVLLPLMAFVLKALYPLSKRYYVEHLLFFVHFHSFFFLILSLQILFMRLAGVLPIPEALAVLTIVVASFYVPIYLFLSMRRVYGQGRIATFLKFMALLVAYLLGFTATMLSALTIAAFSI
jgi:hypothetical protein